MRKKVGSETENKTMIQEVRQKIRQEMREEEN